MFYVTTTVVWVYVTWKQNNIKKPLIALKMVCLNHYILLIINLLKLQKRKPKKKNFINFKYINKYIYIYLYY